MLVSAMLALMWQAPARGKGALLYSTALVALASAIIAIIALRGRSGRALLYLVAALIGGIGTLIVEYAVRVSEEYWIFPLVFLWPLTLLWLLSIPTFVMGGFFLGDMWMEEDADRTVFVPRPEVVPEASEFEFLRDGSKR